MSEVTLTTCRRQIGRQDRVCRHVADAIEALEESRRTSGSIMIWGKGNVAIGLGPPSSRPWLRDYLRGVQSRPKRERQTFFVARPRPWHIGSEMCAATFPTLQRSYQDHQGDQGRIGFHSGRLPHWQQRCGGIGQRVWFAHHTGCARQSGAYRGGVGGRRQRRSDVRTPLPGGRPRQAIGDPSGANNRFEQRIAGKPIGAVQAGARRLAASLQTAEATAPRLIDLDAAHVVMGSRPDRNRPNGGVDAGNCARRGDNREVPRKVGAKRMARVEEDAVAFRHVPPHGAGDHVARRKLLAWCRIHEASAGLVDQCRALPACRLADQGQRRGIRIQRGRVELYEFHVDEYRSGAHGQCETLVECAARIGAVQEQPTHAAGRDHHASCR